MNQCIGWCRGEYGPDIYREALNKACSLLSGDYRAVSADIRHQMLAAAQEMQFELAASLRDQLNAIEVLGKKQLVTAGTQVDTDVIGYAETETMACFAVLHFSDGMLKDKDFEVFQISETPEIAVSSLLKQYYLTN
jgi:excinuclease ABC subunit C